MSGIRIGRIACLATVAAWAAVHARARGAAARPARRAERLPSEVVPDVG